MAKVTPPDFKLVRYFAKKEFHTKYLLSCSDPEPMGMSELLSLADGECKQLWENLSLGYTEFTGHPLLKREAADLHGVGADDTLIIVPQEGIYMAMKVMVDYCRRTWPDEKIHAVATYPAYQSLYENLQSHDCQVSKWTTVPKPGGGWSFDMDDLKSLLQENTRILVVNFPHNPSGFIPTRDMWDEIIEVCKKRKMLLFSDEMYRLTNNDQTPPYPSACALYEDAITLFGLSKAFGIPGLRIGWLCTKNRGMMKALESFKDYITICSSAPSEILGIIGLRNKEHLIDRTMVTVRTNLQIIDSFFARYKDYFGWRRPNACTTTLLELKPALLSTFGGAATEFCDRIRQQCGVILFPAALFDFTDVYVRLGFGRSNLPVALDALETFLNSNGIKSN